MRITKVLMNAVDISVPQYSDTILFQSVVDLSIHTFFTGAPTGNLYIEVSNDETNNPASVTNWITLSGSNYAIASAVQLMYELDGIKNKWFRLVYIPSGGNGTLTAKMYC